ncbi:recombinase family protein [Enterococcus faecalis]|uniref:recombinase family protein n=1 Tax=Enterococcus faecalis TaxID=1351 RepID=UPI0010D11836|nr:recombinase family protein [Enterococcus faecalis]EAE2458035.1 recombinase family protein [Listeria monocytogenes]EAE2458902.1 recombinase family protein [Listeria monocytogenes]HAC6039122.1 recombinase family protein [Listeria monocytogenes]
MDEMKITVIPALKKSRGIIGTDEKPKLRVAAYCRVSTDTDEQATSYEAQVEHYTAFINKNSEWDLAGIYADDGISGTNTKKREAFNRLIDDCMDGKIDMVITKSISRFARNTLDCLKYIRQLKDKHIPVFFEKENINTMDSKGEVLLTIMASLAQQESQSLSQNVKMGWQYRFQQGKMMINTNRFLGYTKDEEGNLVIVPEEAEIIKRIYYEYIEGASECKIAKGLEADGVLTGAGKTKWWPSSLTKMLTNEKYMGDALLAKTYTVDFLSKKRVKNNGIVPQYYVENSHPAILSKEVFNMAQEERARRSKVHKKQRGRVAGNGYSSQFALSGRVICSECGEIYRRIHWNNRGKKSIVWRCVSRVDKTGKTCANSPTVQEPILHQAVMKGINESFTDKDRWKEALSKNVQIAIGSGNAKEIHEIDERLEELQQKLMKLVMGNASYDDVAEEIHVLRDKKLALITEDSAKSNEEKRLNELLDFIEQQDSELKDYDEKLVRRVVEEVEVQGTKLVVKLKSGAEIEVETE